VEKRAFINAFNSGLMEKLKAVFKSALSKFVLSNKALLLLKTLANVLVCEGFLIVFTEGYQPYYRQGECGIFF
jgi:hypothetical protein